MGKKKRRGRRGFRIGKYVNLGFKIAGTVVALSPAIRAVSERRSDPQSIPAYMLNYYTGWNGTSIDQGNLMGGVSAIVGGVVLAKLGGWLGKMF